MSAKVEVSKGNLSRRETQVNAEQNSANQVDGNARTVVQAESIFIRRGFLEYNNGPLVVFVH